jgi:hypothetical protein
LLLKKEIDMDAPITTECEALRAEVVLLADENRRMLNEILELRKTPAYPEAAIIAVWEHGLNVGFSEGDFSCLWADNAAEVARIFTEALAKG